MDHPADHAAETSQASRRFFLLGTAGHIDHGKTSLIRALTGTDTDRLPEEKKRGMTIELGFADLEIDGRRFGVVDVPGHERFVRTMVAGAANVDVGLLVVAADDSVMPQTREHADILSLLGVQALVVAVTKVDVVDPELVGLVCEEVDELLAEAGLSSVATVPVSSMTGSGLEELKTALVEASRLAPCRAEGRPFHMAIDRVFTVAGRGTVVTGSVQRGEVAAGDDLSLLPSGEVCRVRGLQSHGTGYDDLRSGQRAAINVIGVDRAAIERGHELATPGYLVPSRILNVRVRTLGSNARAIRSADSVRLCMGTTDVAVRIVFPRRESLVPGAAGFAQVRSGLPLVAAYGRRFILRDETASRTIGGGVVLQPNARRRLTPAVEASLAVLAEGDEVDRLSVALRYSGFAEPGELRLCALTGIDPARVEAVGSALAAKGGWSTVPGTDVRVVPALLDDISDRVAGRLRRWHAQHPDEPGRPVESVVGWLERLAGKALARPLYDWLVGRKVIKPFGRFACLAEFAPSLSSADERHLRALLDELKASGFAPEPLERLGVAGQVDRKRLQRLATLAVAAGDLVQVGGKVYMDRDADLALRGIVASMIGEEGAVTVASLRERISSSRKHVVPYLEYLDRVGFTRRVGDDRVLGEAGAQGDQTR